MRVFLIIKLEAQITTQGCFLINKINPFNKYGKFSQQIQQKFKQQLLFLGQLNSMTLLEIINCDKIKDPRADKRAKNHKSTNITPIKKKKINNIPCMT